LTGAKYFLEPKTSNDNGKVRTKDIPAYVFPELLYCPKCRRIVTAREAANANPVKHDKCCLNDEKTGNRCNGTLVASRFIVICENGHMEDFPYSWWIHGNKCCTSDKPPRISMYNIENRSDIDSLFVKCENCGRTRGMAGAFAPAAFGGENGYPCGGNHPHLKDKHLRDEGECGHPLKTRLRSSSGVYFPVTMGALSIPPWSREAVKIIEKHFAALLYMDDDGRRGYLRELTTSRVSLERLLDAYERVKTRKESAPPRCESEIYRDEYDILSQGDVGNEEGDYSAFSAEIPRRFEDFFERVTVVDKLTVIEALMGFTRLKPWGGGNDKNNPDAGRIVPLSSSPKDWLPAAQLRGEGIFIRFRGDALSSWKRAIGNRYEKMSEQLSNSCLRSREDRFSEEYVLLHTFAHLLIRQLSNECGYSAASLREKIYSAFSNPKDDSEKMRGILIYLASSDCDGSLGGLISIARNPERFGSILENMLRKAQWCSADPLCITSMGQGFDSLNYSACHDCVLLPETSCEFHNVLLDRASVAGTPEQPRLGLMGELSGTL
ncbi:MAG: DUF1998 domain-containing protein, partial [Synergistaceae bacterium]|nr:DUF1998 domain-containing protein [Synergistaceae bacterium]